MWGAQGQLYKLMQRLEETEPHFIRCIKPNTQQLANVFDQELVLQQLRCCGVLEVVRISRSGYPTRHSHHEFASRFDNANFCHFVSETVCRGLWISSVVLMRMAGWTMYANLVSICLHSVYVLLVYVLRSVCSQWINQYLDAGMAFYFQEAYLVRRIC